MLRIDIRKENCVAILKAIALRNNTTKLLQKATGIGSLTIWKITNDLSKRGFLTISRPARNIRGRRALHFDLCTDFYSIFVIEHPRIFSAIAINIEGRAIYRFDHFKQRNLSLKEDIKTLVGKIRKAPMFKKHCVDVFCTCTDETNKYLPKDYIKTSIEDLIINGLSSEKYITLFKINNKITLSLYSHIVNPPNDASDLEIKRLLPVDELYYYKGELYDGVFDALQNHTIYNISKLL